MLAERYADELVSHYNLRPRKVPRL
jgi:hypothetical protein